ncbi:signal peptidase I [Permianibacter sp. IMCC34836]|uniref:signal peptidase I n=1 Tax=Permianibacter fluminis TaxID=2738515 RepID=UPI0015559F46|nr:signal peptidase I [Permianibacter fluminis]NQD38768.1 signal peptidase I [Permianibacter fluminis]
MKATLTKLLKENRSFLLFLVLMFAFRSSFADWNSVPTGSMKPTIIEGDRILVNKLAYDFKLPFTNVSLQRLSEPQRGDIVVFNSAVANKRLVKRLIGLPGDVVALHDNQLFINSEPAQYSEMQPDGDSLIATEQIAGFQHRVRVATGPISASHSFGPVTVPADHYLMLGDNRDNSADSRFIGFVPRTELVGRSQTVVLSFDYDDYYLPRSDRFLHSL